MTKVFQFRYEVSIGHEIPRIIGKGLNKRGQNVFLHGRYVVMANKI